MNFNEAMKAMLAGKKVKLGSQILDYEDGVLYDSTGDTVDITVAMVDANNYEVVTNTVVIDEDQLYATFDPIKNRWVSTTKPAEHKAAGRKVAVFTFDTAL